MKQANQLLFWLIGLPVGAIVWIAMVGPKIGIFTLLAAFACLGIIVLSKDRREN